MRVADASEERPADVFTIAAVQGRDAALDITISSPHRVDAGEDCTLSAYLRKTTRYREIIAELRRSGIAFRPMVWSSEGRPHPVVKRIMAFAAEIAARKRPNLDKGKFLQRWNRDWRWPYREGEQG